MTQFFDRVKEQSTTTGTGNVTLTGPVSGYQSFSSVFDFTTISFCYVIESCDGNGNANGAWEVGQGYITNSTTLVRDVVFASSNAGALVNFGAGSKNVFNAIPAQGAQVSQLSFNQQYGSP